jgi:hypothetical protein
LQINNLIVAFFALLVANFASQKNISGEQKGNKPPVAEKSLAPRPTFQNSSRRRIPTPCKERKGGAASAKGPQ